MLKSILKQLISAVEATPSQTSSPASVNSFTKELVSGHYTAGIDIPAGVYTIQAIKGSGEVISTNARTGGGIEANIAVKSPGIPDKYTNISLDEGVILSVSGVVVRITCFCPSTNPLKTRNQNLSETITLESGIFIAGKDFPAGVYNIYYISGNGGNVISSKNTVHEGINIIMGPEENNDDSYFNEQAFMNAKLDEGVELEVVDMKIRLEPSK